MKPTKEELLERTTRGSRVFLFDYPYNETTKGYRIPTPASQQKIELALLKLTGCKELSGPYFNGVMAIVIDDQEAAAGKRTDAQWREKIVTTILRYWKE